MKFSIIFVIVIILFTGLFIWGMNTMYIRMESHKDICSANDMSSIVINKGKTVLCVDQKGQVFYLREEK